MRLFNFIYPFISLTILEIGNVINNANSLLSIFVFLIQIIIAILTIKKLCIDIKKHKKVDIEKTENEVKKAHPILVFLISFFNKTKI